METAENIWNLFKVNNKDNPCDVNDVVLVSSLLTLNRFHTLFQVSINVETRYQYMNDTWEPQRFIFFCTHHCIFPINLQYEKEYHISAKFSPNIRMYLW